MDILLKLHIKKNLLSEKTNISNYKDHTMMLCIPQTCTYMDLLYTMSFFNIVYKHTDLDFILHFMDAKYWISN